MTLNPNLWKIRAYHRTHHLHRTLGPVSWLALPLSLLLLGAPALVHRLWPDLPAGPAAVRSAAWISGGALAAGFLVWLGLTGWHRHRFRHLAWRTASLVGAAWRWVAAAPWALLVLIVLTLLALWPGKVPNQDALLWGLLALFVTFAVRSGYQISRRIVIPRFTNHTGDEKLDACVEGLASLLCGELQRIGDLYRTIDENTPRSLQAVPDVSVSVQGAGEVLEGAICPDTKISFGPLQVPVATLIAVAGRLLRGPRVTGTLHQEGQQLFVLAQVEGRGVSGNWRVEVGDLDEEERGCQGSELVNRLVRQLAYRVIATLVPVGSPRWRAVRCYTDGLRAYRETHRTGRKQAQSLRLAERCFIQALDDDNKFAICHYNLGVVYRDLGQRKSAAAAFRRALREDPLSFEASCALAENALTEKRRECQKAIWFADNALRIRPADAWAWILKGYAMRKLREMERGVIDLPPGDPAWREVIELREIALALAWRALCRAELRPGRALRSTAVERAGLCAMNLAVAYAMNDCLKRSRRVFQQALRLVPNDSTLSFELGKTLYRSQCWGEAVERLGQVFGPALSNIDRAVLALRLLAGHASELRKTGNPVHDYEARRAYGCFLDTLSVMAADELNELRRSFAISHEFEQMKPPALRESDAEEKGRRVRDLERIWSTVVKLERSQKEAAAQYRNRLADLVTALRVLARRPGESAAAHGDRLWEVAALAAKLREARGTRDRDALLLDLGRTLELSGGMDRLRDFWDLFGTLEIPKSAPGRDGAEDLAGNRLSDLAWIHAQVAARLARQCLAGDGTAMQRQKDAREAESHLETAVACLEANYTAQVGRMGLHRLWAQACLVQIQLAPPRDPLPRELADRALRHANSAVALDPESAEARLVLGQVYSYLHDFQKADHEWEICRSLNPDQHTLREIARSHWGWVDSLRGPAMRRQELERAFRIARELHDIIENASIESPPDQKQLEDHGWVHYSLGSFAYEQKDYRESIAHLQIARSLGFKPIEGRVRLGWTCYQARAYDEAERAFRDAVREAGRQLRPWRKRPTRSVLEGVYTALAALTQKMGPPGTAQEPGESSPLQDLLAEALLGRALLFADRGVQLNRARRLAQFAGSLLVRTSRGELRSLYYECRGYVELRLDQMEASLESLRQAVEHSASSRAYCRLAKACLAMAGNGAAEPLRYVQEARRACAAAQECDLQEDYKTMIGDLLRELADVERRVGGLPDSAPRGRRRDDRAEPSGIVPAQAHDR